MDEVGFGQFESDWMERGVVEEEGAPLSPSDGSVTLSPASSVLA